MEYGGFVETFGFLAAPQVWISNINGQPLVFLRAEKSRNAF
jgi:hypothetical protein